MTPSFDISRYQDPLTNQRVQLYRQTNIRHRKLLPPPSFRKNAEFPPLKWWPEISLNTHEEA